MPTLNDVKAVSPDLDYASTPQQIQSYIDILTEFLSDILSRRGSSIEEWNRFRKDTVASELQVIDEELRKLEGDTDPLPPVAP